MHIVFFTINMKKGGTERVISNLCNEYLVKRYRVTIVTYFSTDCDYELDKGIKMDSLGFGQQKNPVGKFLEMKTAGKRYLEIMSCIRPDVVLAFLPRPCMVACAMRKKLGVPVIGSIRSDPSRNFKNSLYRMIVKSMYDRADGFVFQTEQAKAFFHKKLQKKSTVIMNPVNEKAVRRPYEGERSKRIVSVGRFIEEKNYPLLIRAFAGLGDTYKDYTLWIYGKYNENLHIKELAASLGLSGRVVFAGQADDVYDAVYDAALYVLSSKSEGMPNALMEAMAMGIPVIATDCPSGGARALVENGKNGLLVPNEDEEALSEAMEKMLFDRKSAMEMGKRACEVGTRYSGQRIYREWDKYIQNVTAVK